MNGDREAYEKAVRRLAWLGAELLESGLDEETVARMLVAQRNELKIAARVGFPQDLVDWMEDRNRTRYGHPVGPTVEQLFERYGSWSGVIAAAARPADLNKRPF